MNARRRTLPLRSLLLIAVGILATLPALVGVVVWLAVGHVQHSREHHAIVAAEHYLVEGRGRWTTTSWQRRATAYFSSLDAEVAMTATPAAATASKTGKRLTETVFATPGLAAIGASKAKLGASGSLDSHQLRLPGTGQRSYAAVVVTHQPSRSTRLLAASLAAAAALVLTLVAILWLLGRWVVSPLAKLSRAADQVAGGDLSIRAPNSRAREIADVGHALIGMSQALDQAHERERKREQERRFLTTAIAHDLRTPPFTLRGYLEALQRGLPARDYLSKATEKAALLESLIGDLFAYSQSEHTGTLPQKKPVEFGRYLGEVVREFEQPATAKEIHLSLSGPAQPVLVPIDRQLVTRALNNLLENALRHTPPGGEVSLHWQPRGGHVEFEIRDNGEGIALEHLPHVFEPFYKVDRSRSPSTSSAGVGLAIARRLIEAHGGTLTADNSRGDGAILRGTLPQSANAATVHTTPAVSENS